MPARASVAYLLMAIAFATAFADYRFALPTPRPYHSLYALLAGKALGPCQYRVLTLWIAKGLGHWQTFGPPLTVPTTLFWQMEVTAVVCLALAYRSYLTLLLKDAHAATLAAPLLFLVLPFHFVLPRRALFWFPYDLPATLFFTLGLIFLYKKRWLPYYLFFIVGTFNKETTCFLTLVYLFTTFGKSPHGVVFRHIAAQATLWIAIKLYLFHLYGQGVFETHWRNNLGILSDPSYYPSLASLFGFTWIPVWLLRDGIEDTFVRRALLVVPVYMVGMICVSGVLEFRIFGELIPVVLPAFTLLLARALRSGNPGRSADQ